MKDTIQEASEELVVKAVCGDNEAVSELIKIYYKDILRFAVRKLGKQDGEEVAQLAVINIIKELANLKDPSKVKSTECWNGMDFAR